MGQTHVRVIMSATKPIGHRRQVSVWSFQKSGAGHSTHVLFALRKGVAGGQPHDSVVGSIMKPAGQR